MAISLVMLTMTAGGGKACLCTSDPTVAEALERSSDVFVGKVLSARHEGGSVRGRIRVDKSWKGITSGRVVTVYTTATTCGLDFAKGKEVIIYAQVASDGPLRGQRFTNLCTRSTGWEMDIAAESDSLGPPLTAGRKRWWGLR